MLTLPKKPKIIEEDGNRAIIEISELYPGYGPTIGNTLRRVLYSSLQGAAITSFKIVNVPHEFSTIDGVLEDVIEISLNLKTIRLKLHGDEAQTIKLKVVGNKTNREVTAKDIDAPSQVEVINKDAHILTLTSPKTSIDMELIVEPGLGYVQTDKITKDKKDIGTVRLDAIFTPIVKVNFWVENMRVGDKTDYNKLLLEILTDGTITPREAYEKAANVLLQHFELIKELEGGDSKKTRKMVTRSKKVVKSKKSSGVKKITTKKKSSVKKTATKKKSSTKKKK